MADPTEKKTQDRGKEKKDKKPAEGERAAQREPAGPPPPPAEPAPRPRLLDYYEQRVRAKLAQQFGFGNAHEIPKLVKIVVNVGMGDAPKNPKALEAAVAELAAITGQRPVVTRAKKAIANFNLREGQAIGCAVTLRGARHARLPGAPDQELRRAGQLHRRAQGADDFPGDRLRQGREDPRDGYHPRHDRRSRRHGL